MVEAATDIEYLTNIPVVSIPTNRVQNHAAFLLPLPDGDMLCAWFSGTMEGKADISIFMSRLRAGTSAWDAPVQLSDDPARSEQNPVLFLDPNGKLWLFHTAQPGGQQDKAVVRFRTSDDLGKTWSQPAQLLSAEGTFVRQPVVVMEDGRWLLPVFRCKTPAGVAWTGEFDDAAVLVSQDKGKNWDIVTVPDSEGCVHMNIVKLDDQRLVAFFRSRFADHVKVSRSQDGGRSWLPPFNSDLPNNNSSIQAVRLADGWLAMVFNRSSVEDATGRRASLYDELDEDENPQSGSTSPASRAFWGAPRSPLSVSFSDDGGETWPDIVDLAASDGYCLSNDSAGKANRELSYPSIAQDSTGRIHIAYTHFRQRIDHMVAAVGTIRAQTR